MLVRPGPGLKIRHPKTLQLHSHDDKEPLEVDEHDLFWARLLEHKDIVPAEEQTKAEG